MPFTKVQFLVLTVLLQCPMHPYAVRQEVIELTARRYFPSKTTIRTTLNRLIQLDMIEECGGETDPNYWFKARRGAPYRLTSYGREQIDKELMVYLEILTTARLWMKQYEIMENVNLNHKRALFAQLDLPED